MLALQKVCSVFYGQHLQQYQKKCVANKIWLGQQFYNIFHSVNWLYFHEHCICPKKNLAQKMYEMKFWWNKMSCCFHLHFIPPNLYSYPSSISKKTQGVYLYSWVPEIMMESVRASITLQGTATDASAFTRSMEMFSNTRRADVC